MRAGGTKGRRALGRLGVSAIAVSLLLLLPAGGLVGLGAAAPTTAGSTAASLPVPLTSSSTLNTTLSVGGQVGYLSNDFWGVTVNNEVHLLRGEANSINATPTSVIVWPGAMAGEDYDPLTNTHYDTYSGEPKTALTSEAQFVQLCEEIHCRAIVQVPAEIDNPAFAEEVVNYTEVNLSFHPAYWMIGNEPELWSHWKESWKQWPFQSDAGPTPTQFGDEVVAYVKAMRQIDNTTPILGLPASGCSCSSWTFAQWISGVLAVTGNQIQAVAFHEYPAGWLGTGDGSLLDFYITIQSAAGITQRMVSARAAVQSSCKGCNVSVFISELGAALSWSTYGQYAAGYSGALSIAAQLTQAMDDNLTNIDLFAAELDTTNSWFNNSGYARPDYSLYTQILGHLGPEVYPVNFTSVGGSMYGIATIDPQDHGRHDLLVVNTNVTHPISFAPQFAALSTPGLTQAWVWNGTIHNTASNATTWVEPSTPVPVPLDYPTGLPSAYTLPPQSMILFETYPSNATYVHVSESGVPAGVPWFAQIGPKFYSTTSANLSLLLPPGAYPVEAAPINLPIGGKELNPTERLAGFVTGSNEVGGANSALQLQFVPQWRVNVTGAPAGLGNVTPNVAWWNQSQPLTLTVTPSLGNAFTRWDGWGPGSYNGTNRTITITPGGPLNEVAHIVPGIPSLFQESGLPAGINWSVTVRGFTTSATVPYLDIYEPYGRYAFHVAPIAGYRILPRNGSFSPAGGTTLIRFQLITPPPTVYQVTFQATGLPSYDQVSITVRSTTKAVGLIEPTFQLINGTYAYEVGYVAGYHAEAPLKLFQVNGRSTTVSVAFVPTVYHTIFAAEGVWNGTSWSVTVGNQTVAANSSWASLDLTNGTYSYSVHLPANFSATPRTGIVTIVGSGAYTFLEFGLQHYAAGFELAGAALGAWSVRLGNVSVGVAGTTAGFQVPNGTYTYDVQAPAGYFPVPSHGNLTVAGPTPSVMITLFPVSEKPSAALVAQLTLGALEVSLWVGLSAALVFVVGRAVRRRGA